MDEAHSVLLILDLLAACANLERPGRAVFVPTWRSRHARSSSRQGRLIIAHRFSGGAYDGGPRSPGTKDSRMVVRDWSLEALLEVESGVGYEPLSSLAGLRSVEGRTPHR